MIFHSTYSKPILLLGNGVRSSGSLPAVHEFIKKTNIPVLTTLNGVDLAQDDMHIGFIGTHGNRVANMILNECDLVISLGARLGIRQVGHDARTFAPNADLIRVDIDEYELSRNIKPNEKKYHMSVTDFMNILLSEEVPDYSNWKQKCFEAKRELSKFDIQPGNLAIKKISSLLPANPNISIDVGMHQCWAAQSLHLQGNEGRIHIGGGYGAMGCGLPYAIGSSIALNKSIVYCICGDGGFQMNIQELEVLKRENLPIKIFILNNRVLGKISETQTLRHDGRLAFTSSIGGYSVPNFKNIAEAYGIKAFNVANFNDLHKYIDSINSKEPCLFDISLPEQSYLEPKIAFETGIIHPLLDLEVIKKVQYILSN